MTPPAENLRKKRVAMQTKLTNWKNSTIMTKHLCKAASA